MLPNFREDGLDPIKYKLVVNDKGYCMKEKVNKYISSFDSIIYVLSHATKMQLFWSQLKVNHMLPRVLIYDYLK